MADPLTDAIVALGAQLDLPHVLDRFLAASTDHTGATYAAINVLDDDGVSVEFHFRGMEQSVWERIGKAPGATGVLGQIPPEGSLITAEITTHPAFRGLPAGHPPLGAFLGTALRVRGEVFGYLYLAGKVGGFTDQDAEVVEALAAAASVAIDHAQLYERAVKRERWLEASQEVATLLVSNPDGEQALQAIVDAALELSEAAHAALVLPGVDDAWVMEVTGGAAASRLLGLTLPSDGHAMSVIRSGWGTIAPEPPGGTVLEPVRDFGPTLYAPLRAGERTVGLLMLWRHAGDRPFDEHDLATAQRFANQAAVALSVAELAHARSVSAMLEDRQRLADDLHDLVSQELFATAMQLESAALDAPDDLRDRLLGTLEHVRRAQHEVRGVMGSLAAQRAAESASSRLTRELVLAEGSLGFAPDTRADWTSIDTALTGSIGFVDDLVAVLRELLSNVARHADATKASVDMTVADGRLTVTVADDGIGPGGAAHRHSGTGNLANRALRHGGAFTLEPATDGADRPGTIATWSVRAPE